MKKQAIVNLVRYHTEKNDSSFRSQVAEIANDFANSGDTEIAQYLMELISDANYYVPQANYHELRFLTKLDYSTSPLLLPDVIEEEIVGITRAINRQSGMSKFLFFGVPGSGKTESVYQIARILNRDLLSVNLEQLVDSRLGETAKNVTELFAEINRLPPRKAVILLDELDALVLDRINQRDVREMGRVTSAFIRGLDAKNNQIPLIATTNLFSQLDKAMIRRFDAIVSFDRYSREDLVAISENMLIHMLKNAGPLRKDIRLFKKILSNLDQIPYPGDMKQIIRTAIAFSDESNEYDYLRRIYLSLNNNPSIVDIQSLKSQGFTTREIEILSRIPKSSVSRKLRT